MQGECNGPAGARSAAPYPPVGNVARNEPHRIRNWHSVPYPASDQYQETITSDSNSTCLVSMMGVPNPNLMIKSKSCMEFTPQRYFE